MSLKLFGLGILFAVGAWGNTYTYSYSGMPFDSGVMDDGGGLVSLSGPGCCGGGISAFFTLSRPLQNGDLIGYSSPELLEWGITGGFVEGILTNIIVSGGKGGIISNWDILSQLSDAGGFSFFTLYQTETQDGNDIALFDAEYGNGFNYKIFRSSIPGTWAYPVVAPEPSLFAALGLGLAGLAGYRRARNQ